MNLPFLGDSDRSTIRHIVDNRAFLLGLDGLYRDAVKSHEREELLACARRTAQALRVQPADVPIEGYYAEDEDLSQYFRLVRALQDVEEGKTPKVATLPEFRRLYDVVSSPLYGRAQSTGKLLPVGRDALSEALSATWPAWTVENLTAVAAKSARDWDDISLVGLAARIRDPVVVTALRESVVLYAGVEFGRAPPRIEFIWQVDPDLAAQAGRFIEVFNELFAEALPAPVAEHAEQYWNARDDVIGRCVRIGGDPSKTRHYHWAICRAPDGRERVQEFWDDDIWTTARYRGKLGAGGRCPNL